MNSREDSVMQITKAQNLNDQSPQFEEDKQIIDEPRNQISELQNRSCDAQDDSINSLQPRQSDDIETKEMLKIQVNRECIINMLRDQELRIKNKINEECIEYCKEQQYFNGEKTEVSKKKGEDRFFDESKIKKEDKIDIFIKRQEIEQFKINTIRRNANLNIEIDNDLLIIQNKTDLSNNKKNNEGNITTQSTNINAESQNSEQPPLLYRDSQVDLVFLSSDPLVQKAFKDCDSLIEFENPLNAEQEFKQICQKIQSTKRNFTVMRDIATRSKLLEAFEKKPLMMHISCHGRVQEENGGQQYYLLFEKSEEYCLLENIKDSNFKDALQLCFEKSLAIVFVSACYSEGIAKLFKKCGVPVVIAINQITQINDKAAIKFAEEFYKQIVLGKTPLQSFHFARDMVSADKHIPLYSCCCAHEHESWCKWKEKFISKKDIGGLDSHSVHCHDHKICICKNKNANIHSQSCTFYNNFKKQYCPQGQDFITFQIQEKEIDFRKDPIQLCCCKAGLEAELAHNEYQKFKIIDSEGLVPQNYQQLEEQVLKARLFNRQQGNKLDIQWNYKEKDKLIKHIPEYIIGRHIQIHKIFKFIHNREGMQFLHIYGISGMCKTFIANYAAKYALYGRSDLDGAIYILAEQATNYQSLIKLMYERLRMKNGIECKVQSKEAYVLNEVATRRLVIIFDRMQNFIKYEQKRKQPWVSFIKLISLGKTSKYIAISSNQNDFQGISCSFMIEQLQINELSALGAARLLISTTQNDIQKIDGILNEKNLSNHAFFKSKQYPLIPIALLNLIKNHSLKALVDALGKQKKQQNPQEIENNPEIQTYDDKQLKIIEEPQKQEIGNAALEKVECNESSQLLQYDRIEVNIGAPISAFDLITDQNLSLLTQALKVNDHQVQYQLFLIACIAPEGFLECELDEICRINIHYINFYWRNFFDQISSEYSKEVKIHERKCEGQNKEVEENHRQTLQTKKLPVFFDLQKKQDLISSHYLPAKIVCDHFYQNYLDIIRKYQIQDFLAMIIKYMNILARDVLITEAQMQKNNIHMDCICASNNIGIWKQEFVTIMNKEDTKQKKQNKKAFQKQNVKILYA